MEKYYRITNESPAYITGIILDPNTKWKYIENNWKADWVPNIKDIMEKLWNEYKPPDSTSTIPSQSITPLETSTKKNAFIDWKKYY
jgi:hypothetical protein